MQPPNLDPEQMQHPPKNGEKKSDWCKTCSKIRYLVVKLGDFSVAIHCPDCKQMCDFCADTGVYYYEKNNASYAADCPKCSPLAKRIEVFNRAKLPSTYAGLLPPLLTFKHSEGLGPNPLFRDNLLEVFSYVTDWEKNFRKGETKKGFLLHGRPGVGKTHMLAGVVWALTLGKGYSVKFIEYSHLISDLKEAFDSSNLNSSSILREVLSADVLAIDEIGKGRPSAYNMDVIDELISRSYNSGKIVIGTSNLKLTEDHKGPKLNSNDFKNVVMNDSSLKNAVGERVFSRLHKMMDFVHVSAVDRRLHPISHQTDSKEDNSNQDPNNHQR